MAAAATVVLSDQDLRQSPTGRKSRQSFWHDDPLSNTSSGSGLESDPKKSRSHVKSVISEKGVAEFVDSNSQAAMRRTKTCDVDFLPLGQRMCPKLAGIVLSRNFEVFIGLVIIVNCGVLGLEAEILLGRAEDLEVMVEIVENIITSIFVIEIFLRIFICGFSIYAPAPGNFMNIFDAFLVFVTGVLVVWVMPLLGIDSHDTLRALNVLRAFRLARLVRVLANFEIFHEVWLLLRGLMESGRVLFWTIVVIFIITYIFAIFGVTILSIQIKEEYEEIVDPKVQESSDLKQLKDVTYGVLPLMYTLIQVLTLDSWNGIARPMMRYIPWCWVYFYGYIAIAVIVMMNLVTAVIVDNALRNSQKDANALLKQKELLKQAKLAHFRQVFEDMDSDGNGELSWPEFESAFEDDELGTELRMIGIEPDSCRDIFNLLDNGDGVLSVDEFFEGLQHMEGSANAKDLLKTNKQIELLIKMLVQQNLEFREDLDEVLSSMGGAKLRDRKGTFKSRAGRRRYSELDDNSSRPSTTPRASAARTTSLHSALSSKLSATSPEGASKMFGVAQQGDGTLGDAVERLEQIAGLIHGSRDDFKGSVDACMMRVDACSQKMAALIKDMGEFKERLTYDYVVSLDGSCSSRHRKAQLVTPKSQWRKEFEIQLPSAPGKLPLTDPPVLVTPTRPESPR